MIKYYLHNSSYGKAEVVVLGVPDASGSRSLRKSGIEKGPDYIRKVSQKFDLFKWKGEKARRVESSHGIIKVRVCDIGNVPKKLLVDGVRNICEDEKVPLIFGGDHSLTALSVKGVASSVDKLVFVYFDAHPDFRCGFGNYYGSVLCELQKLKNIFFKNSVLIGMRAPEKAEVIAIKKSGLLVITPEDIELLGVKKVIDKINKRIGKLPIYLSVDLDVADPSAAPGVDTPVSGGLSAVQLLALIEQISKKKIIGADVVEVNPRFDIQNQTGHLASRVVAEMIASCQKSYK